MTSSLLEQLIEAFRILPGVGQKTAQRMAYHEPTLALFRHLGLQANAIALVASDWRMRWLRRWSTSGIARAAAISAKATCARPAPARRATCICCVRSNRPPIAW